MRDILQEVAEGRLSPDEAMAQIAEREGAADRPRAPEEPPAAAPDEAVRRVRVVRHLGPIEVIGDITISEAVAGGAHVAHREGDTLVVEAAENRPYDSGFAFGMRHGMGWGFGGDGMHQNPLTVRMNPALALEVSVQAGLAQVRGVVGPLRVEVQAGSATITGFASPLDVSVQMGSVRADGRLQDGASRIRCEAGTVTLRLAPESSVRIAVHSTLGRVRLPGGDGWALGATDHEATVGSGSGTLDIDATMGAVSVAVDG